MTTNLARLFGQSCDDVMVESAMKGVRCVIGSLRVPVSGDWSAWRSEHVEVQQHADAKAHDDNPIWQRVVEQLITHASPCPA